MIEIIPITHPFNKTLNLPGSRSISNRALILAALAQGTSTLNGLFECDDINACVSGLRSLGVNIAWNPQENKYLVTGTGGHFNCTNSKIWCEASGTTSRFLLALCAQIPAKHFFDGTTRLRERPMAPLLQVLREQGAKTDPLTAETLPLTLVGAEQLQGGEIYIPGTLSSQFLSGLLLVAPFAKSAVKLITDTKLVSRSYVAMTVAMMRQFGVEVEVDANFYRIRIPQSYVARDYLIEPDLSTASYFFAAAALNQSKITLAHINRTASLQGDVQFLSVLEQMGCHIENTVAGVSLTGPQQLAGIEVDMNDFSDTFMTLACLAPFASAPVRINNIKHVRLQESDRLAVVQYNFDQLKIRYDIGEDYLTIYPSTPVAAMIDPHDDHRIAMAFSLVGLKIPGITINNPSCVNKTCPDYFQYLHSLNW